MFASLTVRLQRGHVLDATRILDGSVVVLKRISRKVHPYEAEIGRLLSSEPLASDPCNRCIPLLDVLQDPEDEDLQLLVMPMLQMCIMPSFGTVGEAVEFFRQAFEVCSFAAGYRSGDSYFAKGMQFMHKHNIAHRYVPDCVRLSLLMVFAQRCRDSEYHDGP